MEHRGRRSRADTNISIRVNPLSTRTTKANSNRGLSLSSGRQTSLRFFALSGIVSIPTGAVKLNIKKASEPLHPTG